MDKKSAENTEQFLSSSRQEIQNEYRSRLRSRLDCVEKLALRSNQISNLRLIIFLLAAGVFFLGAYTGWFSAAWSLLPLAGFVLLVMHHARLSEAEIRSQRSVSFYEAGLARLEGRWAGKGIAGHEYHDSEHIYSRDLDLFGEGSLFEMICTARTRIGERTVADWLKAPALPQVIRERQESVQELTPLLDYRERLWQAGSHVRGRLHPDSLVQWAARPVLLQSKWQRIFCRVLATATICSLIFWLWQGTFWPFLLAILTEFVTVQLLRNQVDKVLGITAPLELSKMDEPLRDLEVLSEILMLIEQQSFWSEPLLNLQKRLETEGLPPSQQVERLDRLVRKLDQGERNQILIPFAALLMWKTQVAFSIEQWRKKCGYAIPAWIDAVGELEALCSLASFAGENPDYAFPDILESGEAFLEGKALGHPLLHRDESITNDFSLGQQYKLVILSGSNMSGKSTFLRTLGVNTVLAQAGAPVCAESFTLTPLLVGASIQVQDSIREGSSRFYAEITRIKQIYELMENNHAVLFLLDEVLQGTNSHDRKIGAEGILASFLKRGAIGIATTHDLALAEIADQLGSDSAANFHFEDQLIDGKMIFDYRLRSGMVRKSNALELMRAVGLKISNCSDLNSK